MKIIIFKEDKPVDQVTVTGKSASVGRKSECDISIKDPAVSGHHAEIEKVGDNYVIKDLGSTNGIFVKGRRVKEQLLRNEDVVTIGEHRLKFLIGGTVGADTKAPASGGKARPARGATGKLKILSGPDAGTTLALEEGLTTIGMPGVQVAAVSRRPQGYFIIHVDGGKDRERVPLVNDEPIGFKSRKLEDADRIEVAGIKMEYEES